MKDSSPMIRRPLSGITKCTSALFLVQLKRKKSQIKLLTKAVHYRLRAIRGGPYPYPLKPLH